MRWGSIFTMNNYKTTGQLRAIAKEQSLGKYGTLIGANIIILALQFFVTLFTSFASEGSIILFFINSIISLIVNILLGLLVSGKAYLYMNLLYSQPVSTSDIFFGMKQQPQKAVAIQALFAGVDFVIMIPIQLLYAQYLSTKVDAYLLTIMIIGIVAVIAEVYVALTYSQAFYLLHDFPDRSAKELLATSRHLMKGNRFRLLYLYVGFIPLYLLGAVALFIPLLWVSVYKDASLCSFYQDLIATANFNSNNQ